MEKHLIIDTHCHLYLPEFKNDLEAVIERAGSEGVKRFYLPAIDSGHIEEMLLVEQLYSSQCFAMMGLHPCSVKGNYEDELKLADQWLRKRPFAAIGEVGLDYYWDKTLKEEQQKAFDSQIRWSSDYRLPLVIHSRDALDDCIQQIASRQRGELYGIFHCFSGTLEQAKKIIDLGFFLGIGGVLTYKNAGLAEVVKELPLENMVLETDAPYLTPVPFRGKRNESSYLKYVLEKLALIKETTVEEVADLTTINAQKIFGKPL